MSSSDHTPYNPLDIANLATSVGLALETLPQVNLDEIEQFNGAGLYALYYRGHFALYRRIVEWNANGARMPIYVGKAVVGNARKGGGDFTTDTSTDVLYRRILKHRSSIQAATNLDTADFSVRALVTVPVWIPLGETSLIARYRPLWNVAIDGFGNNDPGARRREQYRSVWDIIHPGRAWAARQAENPVTVDEIERRVRAHLDNALVVAAQPPIAE